MKKNPQKSVQILGVNVSVTTIARVLARVVKKLQNNPLSRERGLLVLFKKERDGERAGYGCEMV